MHGDEIEIGEALVRSLLREQFPLWSELRLERIQPAGTVHAIFRLGDELSLRLARHDGPTAPGSKELDWLPRLAPTLPFEVPMPVAQGRPGQGYPWFWEIHEWVEGETVPMETIDAIEAARDLAAFVGALHRLSPAGAPRGRGVPHAERDAGVRHWLARFDGDPRAAAA